MLGSSVDYITRRNTNSQNGRAMIRRWHIFCVKRTQGSRGNLNIQNELGRAGTNRRWRVDSDRFDTLTKAVGINGSRRVLLSTAAKGGVGALLAAVGIGTFDSDAEAAVKCGKKCRRRKGKAKKRCLQRCRRSNKRKPRSTTPVSAPIGVGPVGIGGSCSTSAQCASGNCTSIGICAACNGVRVCGNRCCAVDASCLAGLCIRL